MDKLKILVVDDEYENREILKEVLERSGYDVLLAEDGEQALNLFNSQQDIDLVLTDQKMPNMNGYTLIDRLREKRSYKELPIILVTGTHVEKEETKNRLKSGQLQAVLSKPFDLMLINNSVKLFLKKKTRGFQKPRR